MEAPVEIAVAPGTRDVVARDLGPVASKVRFSLLPTLPKSRHRGVIVFAVSEGAKLRRDWIQAAEVAHVHVPVIFYRVDSLKPALRASTLQALIALAATTGKHPYMPPDSASLRRLVMARCARAERSLIASASTEGRTLLVWSCEPRLFQLSADEIPALAALTEQELANFEVSTSGSRIHWPKRDIDLDLESFRAVADPEFARECAERYRRERARYGAAVRKVREECGLLQSRIPGVTEREVRRLEKGESAPRAETLLALARAHGMTLAEYVERLAAVSAASRKELLARQRRGKARA